MYFYTCQHSQNKIKKSYGGRAGRPEGRGRRGVVQALGVETIVVAGNVWDSVGPIVSPKLYSFRVRWSLLIPTQSPWMWTGPVRRLHCRVPPRTVTESVSFQARTGPGESKSLEIHELRKRRPPNSSRLPKHGGTALGLGDCGVDPVPTRSPQLVPTLMRTVM